MAAVLGGAVLAWPATTAAQCTPMPAVTDDYQGFAGRLFKDAKSGATMPYRLFKPAGYEAGKAYPMVLYLHHAGLVGTDNCRQLTGEAGSGGYGGVFSHSAQRKYPHFVVAPQATNSNFGWGGGMPGSFARAPHATHALIYGILEQVRAEFNIDPRRVYVTGISMGCFGSWDLVMRNPTYFAATSAQSCGGDPAGLPRIVALPVWSFCGSEDPLFAKQSDIMAAEFKKLNPLDFTYTVIPGVGHSVINRGYDWVGPPSLIDWLFGKTNKSASVPDGGPSQDARPANGADAQARDGGVGGGNGGGGTPDPDPGAGGASGAGAPALAGGGGNAGSVAMPMGQGGARSGAAGGNAGAGGASPAADTAGSADAGGCSCNVGQPHQAGQDAAAGWGALTVFGLGWLARRGRSRRRGA
jgi:poly(3-hydroxybutyrate) depolymerase